jgi:hypothetical protein
MGPAPKYARNLSPRNVLTNGPPYKSTTRRSHVHRYHRSASTCGEGRGIGASFEREKRFEPEVHALAAELELRAAADERQLIEVAFVTVDVVGAPAFTRHLLVEADAEEALRQDLALVPHGTIALRLRLDGGIEVDRRARLLQR